MFQVEWNQIKSRSDNYSLVVYDLANLWYPFVLFLSHLSLLLSRGHFAPRNWTMLSCCNPMYILIFSSHFPPLDAITLPPDIFFFAFIHEYPVSPNLIRRDCLMIPCVASPMSCRVFSTSVFLDCLKCTRDWLVTCLKYFYSSSRACFNWFVSSLIAIHNVIRISVKPTCPNAGILTHSTCF